MAHCMKCGTQVTEGAGFCQNCGEQQPAGVRMVAPPSGMSQNTAATLSYVLGWITGIIFLLIDKRPYVRFHAAQSIVVFGAFHVLTVGLAIVLGLGGMGLGYGGYQSAGAWGMFGLAAAVMALFRLGIFILWIVLMVKSSQGLRYQVPGVEGLVNSVAGSQR